MNAYSGRLIGIVDSKTSLGAYEEIICKIPFTERYAEKPTEKIESFAKSNEDPVEFKESHEVFESPNSKGVFPAREFKKYKKIDREFKNDKR